MLEMWVAESQLGTIRGKVLSLTLGLGKLAGSGCPEGTENLFDIRCNCPERSQGLLMWQKGMLWDFGYVEKGSILGPHHQTVH